MILPRPATVEDLAERLYAMECRLHSYELIMTQVLRGEDEMAKTYEKEIADNPIKIAEIAGLKAGLEGASDAVPADIAQVPLQTISWLRGYAKGKRMRAKQTAACL